MRQLEFGLPTDALPLTSLPTALSRGEYLALFALGVSALGVFWKMLTNQLSDVLTSGRIAQLEGMRPAEDDEERKVK